MKRILVVGGGLIGMRHLRLVADHPGCDLAGLADPDMSLAPDVPRFADMADAPDGIDGVIIATPTGLHGIHGQYAATRGWHMLIEKPVTEDLSQAKALSEAVAKAGVGSLVGHHRRYHACVQQLKALLADGALGTPVAASLIWAMRKPDTYFQNNWRSTSGSPVLINLVHDIDILRFVLGEISECTALRGRGLRGSSRVESGAIAIAFENGATGTISFADTTPSPWGFEAGTGENPNIGTTRQDMMWIMGTQGAVSFPSMTLWSGTDWGTAASCQPLKANQNVKPPLDAQLDHFIEVMNGSAPMIDVADATRTLAVALELQEELARQ